MKWNVSQIVSSFDKKFVWFRLRRNMAVSSHTRLPFSEHSARKSHVNHTLLAILSYVLLTKGIDQTLVWKVILFSRSLARSLIRSQTPCISACYYYINEKTGCDLFTMLRLRDSVWRELITSCVRACVRVTRMYVYCNSWLTNDKWTILHLSRARIPFSIRLSPCFHFIILLLSFININELFLLLLHNDRISSLFRSTLPIRRNCVVFIVTKVKFSSFCQNKVCTMSKFDVQNLQCFRIP